MRILNHDYAGHPFQVQLSRELARRGHEVLHVYSASNQTPHGALTRLEGDAPGLEFAALRLVKPFQKYSYVQRRKQELEYGRLAADEIKCWHPDVVLSGNTPLEAQRLVYAACKAVNSRFIFWVQDLYSIAVHKILRKRLPVVGSLVGRFYMALERRLLRKSDGVVLITEDFRPLMESWGVESARTHVIHNWAPLDAMPVHSKANAWSKEHGLDTSPCLVYSGTLGMKHNADMLLQLALHFAPAGDAKVVVISEGPETEWLKAKKAEHHADNLIVLGWQPFDMLPEVLASADVLLAILAADAGVFSVPSKVLSYLCAARPLLIAVPPDNLAARIVRDNEAGLLVAPDDMDGFVQAAATLIGDAGLRERLAGNARRYAETHFDIRMIADRFEAIMTRSAPS